MDATLGSTLTPEMRRRQKQEEGSNRGGGRREGGGSWLQGEKMKGGRGEKASV